MGSKRKLFDILFVPEFHSCCSHNPCLPTHYLWSTEMLCPMVSTWFRNPWALQPGINLLKFRKGQDSPMSFLWK